MYAISLESGEEQKQGSSYWAKVFCELSLAFFQILKKKNKTEMPESTMFYQLTH